MDDYKFLPKLSQNLLEVLNGEHYYDVTIEVGKDPYVKVFHAHMVVLHCRSPYLQRILSINNKKNDGIISNIKLPNISPEIFHLILRYIYGGRLSLEEYDASDIIKILVASCDLGLNELISYLQSFLVENKASWMEQNFDFVYQTIFKYDLLLDLQNYCTNLIRKEPEKIFKSPNFTSISEKLLVTIIQSDNLQMNEFQVWGYVLKWGHAQNPGLPSEIVDFSKDDFNTLKNTLQKFIPFIKFYDFTSKEFKEKVLPYKKILPKELYKELLNTYLDLSDPNSKPNDEPKPQIVKETKKTKETELGTVDSKIMTHHHVELISKWINRLEITDNLTTQYEFKLLFRASRDGYCRDKFHEICNNKSPTVTVVKVEGSNEILGGYNPVEWKSDSSYGITKDSFIFSFNNDGTKNYILSRVMDGNNATYNSSSCGPKFGRGDLVIWSTVNGCSCKKAYYEKPIRKVTNEFDTEECEIFQIV
ncbi:carbohydrate-binding module family 13 protein [Rhizophagus clarus]|uniref:Carbohydrate-binding module family 13 protein n=1 Tax=Rhizophagus clarus TaxID=94130 RepID=A0A8H3KWS1_9GLOM|nr:carbohydrate-binding module family 13 protein [Rhizophagus clarus]